MYSEKKENSKSRTGPFFLLIAGFTAAVLLTEAGKIPKNDCRAGEDREKDAALLYRDFNANRDVVLLFEPSDELFTIISESMLDKKE